MTNLRTIGRIRARIRKAAAEPPKVKRALATLAHAQEHMEDAIPAGWFDMDPDTEAAWDILAAARKALGAR